MNENKKPLRVFHVDDDTNILSSFRILVEIIGGEYYSSEDFESFKDLVVKYAIPDFNNYKNIFISDGQFPSLLDSSNAYLEVIEFLENTFDKRYFTLIVISGEESIVKDAKRKGYLGFIKGEFSMQEIKGVLDS
ncbi:MAG: hypothetical protein LAT82_00730 [Nanoarchaeota archaeon]|nr:hypothetical protein [Nanoarchaeota archaeon]